MSDEKILSDPVKEVSMASESSISRVSVKTNTSNNEDFPNVEITPENADRFIDYMVKRLRAEGYF